MIIICIYKSSLVDIIRTWRNINSIFTIGTNVITYWMEYSGDREGGGLPLVEVETYPIFTLSEINSILMIHVFSTLSLLPKTWDLLSQHGRNYRQESLRWTFFCIVGSSYWHFGVSSSFEPSCFRALIPLIRQVKSWSSRFVTQTIHRSCPWGANPSNTKRYWKQQYPG